MDTQQNFKFQIDKLEQEINETKELLNSPSYAELAKVEITRLEEEKAVLEKSLEALENPLPFAEASGSKPSSSLSPTSSQVILEIRAAAGGNEAGLFAADLYRMYQKFAQSKDWKVSELSKNEGGLGNLKEVTFEVSAKKGQKNPYELLQYEAGVHRVQRKPTTEKSGRIHTSTATVVVLPVVSEVEVKIDPNDLKIDTFRSSGPGGQHMQKTESAVRITHLPTGITASSQEARHQLANRENALKILRARLFTEMQSQQKESLDELRAEVVGRGLRSEKIRTYNFPQNRVTDHRLKKSWHNLEEILSGDLMPVLTELQSI